MEKVGLLPKERAKPKELSGGQKQRFSIACALVNNPKVLFLDEPTTGLDPQAKRNLWNLVRELNVGGMTIVLTTHNMEEAESLCDRIAIMDKGKLIAEDTPRGLIDEYASEPIQETLKGNLKMYFLPSQTISLEIKMITNKQMHLAQVFLKIFLGIVNQ